MTAALAHCSVCGGDVVDTATGCHHCGARFTTSRGFAALGMVASGAQLILWGLVALIGLAVLIAALAH